MVTVVPLPPLRQELGLFPAPPASDGTPAWTLHDPPSNRFFHLAWPAFEILSRWSLGTVGAIVEAVRRETTLQATDADVLGVLTFLEQNFLIEAATPQASERLAALQRARRISWSRWLLKNYLFVRIPLFRPQRFLDWAAPMVARLYYRAFFIAAGLAALAAAFLISRQWDIFRHAFSAYRNWEGIVAVGGAVALTKVVHEFGHAFTAHRYGCRVPTMGLALVVLAPMLYTDTNEAWKLTSRRRRLAIGVSGMAAEMLFSLAAIWGWLLLPDGPLRGAAFILATTTWLLTLVLNASPFMRFDGYFILSDILGISNLHQRSFAFGSWWLRERLFGLGDPPPEPASRGRQRFLILFAYAAWLYRLGLFLGIALLVYHYFFKALGIFLFAVEIGWFILLPVYREVQEWLKYGERIRINGSTVRSLLLLFALLALLVIPWQGRLAVPAVLSAVREQQVTAPLAAIVVAEPGATLSRVRAGDILVQLASPDLEQRIRQARTVTSVSRWQVSQQTFDGALLSQGSIPRRRLDAGATELAGLLQERERLSVRAPFDGVIATRNEDLRPGVWVARKEPLYWIVDMKGQRVDAYVGERDLERIAVGMPGRFFPDAPEFGRYECRIVEIDRVNVPFIDEPSLASLYGGPIEARQDAYGLPVPTAPLFRVRLAVIGPGAVPALKLKGQVRLEAEKRSLLVTGFRAIANILARESGF